MSFVIRTKNSAKIEFTQTDVIVFFSQVLRGFSEDVKIIVTEPMEIIEEESSTNNNTSNTVVNSSSSNNNTEGNSSILQETTPNKELYSEHLVRPIFQLLSNICKKIYIYHKLDQPEQAKKFTEKYIDPSPRMSNTELVESIHFDNGIFTIMYTTVEDYVTNKYRLTTTITPPNNNNAAVSISSIFVSQIIEVLAEMANTCDFLDMVYIATLITRTMAFIFKQKLSTSTTNEFRQIFRIQDDFTQDEKDEMELEHSFVSHYTQSFIKP